MMIRILNNSHGHPFFRALKRVRAPPSTEIGDAAMHDTPTIGSASKAITETPNASMAISNAHRSFCKACSLAKLNARPSFASDSKQNISFLQRIQGDICVPIKPKCEPFRYFRQSMSGGG